MTTENRTFTLKGGQFVQCSLECGVEGRRDHGLLAVRYQELGVIFSDGVTPRPVDTCNHADSPNQADRSNQRRICYTREAVLYEALSSAQKSTPKE